MSGTRGWLWSMMVAATVAMICTAARAENPRVSLKVTEATPTEALQQLGRASGVRVEYYTTPLPTIINNVPLPGRVSFDWSDISFARALRQLCDALGLQPSVNSDGYVLYPRSGPQPGPKRTGLFEKNGVRMYIRAIDINDRRSIKFANDASDSGPGGMSIQVGCELENGDAELISGLQNVVARDDQGVVLEQDPARSWFGYYPRPYPDEWTGTIGLKLPSPKAKRLASIDGDLMMYRSVRSYRIEVPLPPAEKSWRKQSGDWLIVVSRFEPEHHEAPDDDTGLPPLQAAPAKFGPGMRVRIYYPNASKVISRSPWGMIPYLEDTSGKTYPYVQISSASAADGQQTLLDYNLVFPATASAPAKLVWVLAERSDPVKLCSFHVTEIPLPGPPAPVKPEIPVPGPEPDTERAFYAKGGGAIVSRVQIGGNAVTDGSLQIGLAPKTATGWGAIRWTEATFGPDGAAHLDDVKPGSYRLHRKFRPRDPEKAVANGRWVNAMVPIQVTAGKETVVPPLQWTR